MSNPLDDPASIEALIKRFPSKARAAFERGSWPALAYLFCAQCYGGNIKDAKECDDIACPLYCRKLGGKFILPGYTLPDPDPERAKKARKMAIKGQEALKKARERKER